MDRAGTRSFPVLLVSNRAYVMERATTEKKPTGYSWSLAGQTRLPVDSFSMEAVDRWFQKTLEPFRIPIELYGKLKTSVAAALSRLKANQEAAGVVAIRLYLSQEIVANQSLSHSWGFFKLEKSDNSADAGTFAAHVLEFYLYLER